MCILSTTRSTKAFSPPSSGSARYLAVEAPCSTRHHVEMYSPSLLHPHERDNVFIWAAKDLRKVCAASSVCVGIGVACLLSTLARMILRFILLWTCTPCFDQFCCWVLPCPFPPRYQRVCLSDANHCISESPNAQSHPRSLRVGFQCYMFAAWAFFFVTVRGVLDGFAAYAHLYDWKSAFTWYWRMN